MRRVCASTDESWAKWLNDLFHPRRVIIKRAVKSAKYYSSRNARRNNLVTPFSISSLWCSPRCYPSPYWKRLTHSLQGQLCKQIWGALGSLIALYNVFPVTMIYFSKSINVFYMLHCLSLLPPPSLSLSLWHVLFLSHWRVWYGNI